MADIVYKADGVTWEIEKSGTAYRIVRRESKIHEAEVSRDLTLDEAQEIVANFVKGYQRNRRFKTAQARREQILLDCKKVLASKDTFDYLDEIFHDKVSPASCEQVLGLAGLWSIFLIGVEAGVSLALTKEDSILKEGGR